MHINTNYYCFCHYTHTRAPVRSGTSQHPLLPQLTILTRPAARTWTHTSYCATSRAASDSCRLIPRATHTPTHPALCVYTGIGGTQSWQDLTSRPYVTSLWLNYKTMELVYFWYRIKTLKYCSFLSPDCSSAEQLYDTTAL